MAKVNLLFCWLQDTKVMMLLGRGMVLFLRDDVKSLVVDLRTGAC